MDLPENGPDFPGDEEALLRFLAQFGIKPDANGQLDLDKLMAALDPMLTTMATQLSGFGGSDDSGMNWGLTQEVIRRTLATAGSDPVPTPNQVSAIRDAVALADLWLDEELSFDRLTTTAVAWRQTDWVEQSLAVWQQLVRPVVGQLSLALTELLTQSAPIHGAEQLLRMSMSGMFATQVGQSLGQLASHVLSSGDVGLPLTSEPRVALLPSNIAQFTEGLETSVADALLFLALRESARQRLFAATGWLGPQLLALVEHYAREITIDPDVLGQAMEAQLGQAFSSGDLERAGEAFVGSLFAPQLSEEQHAILGRLETLLALIEGWVDHVVAQVAEPRMPAASALIETLRRRRATGGPAETALKALVGLELRPRRTRDANNLWAAIRAVRGPEARDATWAHPDLLPTSRDLSDPLGFAEHGPTPAQPDEMDAELARLLDAESGE